MELTIDQIKEAVGKQPTLKTAIISSFKNDFVTGAEAEGLVVRTKDQDTQFLNNHVNAVVEDRVKKDLQKKVDEEFGNAMRKIDEEIKALTGLDKKAGEKTTEYAKRVIEEKRQGGDPVTKEKVMQLEQLLQSTKSDYEKKLSDAQTQLFDKEIEWQVSGALDKASIAVPVHLKTDEEKQSFINQQKALIKNGFLTGYTRKKDEQGNVIFYKGETPQMNSRDGKPKQAADIIGEDYSAWFVPPGQKATGTGTGGTGGGAIPAGGFKKKEEIHEYLKTNGIEAGSRDYMTKLAELAKESKIDI